MAVSAKLFPGIDPQGDANGNGVENLIEYVVVPDSLGAGRRPRLPRIGDAGGEFRLSTVSRIATPDVVVTLESSADLGLNWETLDAELLTSTDLGGGFREFVNAITPGERIFCRQRVDYQNAGTEP